MVNNLNHQIGGFPKVCRLCIDPGLHNRTKFMAVLFTRCLVARQLLSPKLIERERVKNGQARRHARGEKAPARETHENRFPPSILAAAV